MARQLRADRVEVDAARRSGDHGAVPSSLTAVRQILEPRVLLDERELGDAGRTVALLADDDLGDALGFLFGLPSASRYCPRGR